MTMDELRLSVTSDAGNVTPNEEDEGDYDKLISNDPHDEGIKTGSRSIILD